MTTDYGEIPDETIEGINRYMQDRVQPGSFLAAVLQNDLKNAVGRADPKNLQCLPAIVLYCFWELPSLCWGSKEAFEGWVLREIDSYRQESRELRDKVHALKSALAESGK